VLYAAKGQAAGRQGKLLLAPSAVADVAASFQYAVVRALVKRTLKAAREKGVKGIALGGGVAANKQLRAALALGAEKYHLPTAIPPLALCGDNAVMIAARAWEMFAAGQFSDYTLDAAAR
jgi:N6-L-threonylcarbamoyladenine synthase